jgi:hypothetical protein
MWLTSRRPIALLLVVAASACASTPRADGDAPSAGNRTVITDGDLSASGSESAYDIVQRLRPEFLRAKPSQSTLGSGAITAPPLALIANGQRVGALEDLRRIPAQSLSRIRYYSVEEAKRTFGMQYTGGAIELTYRTH